MNHISKTGIWGLELAKKKHRYDSHLARCIPFLFYIPPESTADLGCGKGDYCKYLESLGWPNVVGYEGTPNIELVDGAYKNIKQVDLTDINLYRKLECVEFVLCLEVAEHIPKDYESFFVNNMCSIASRSILLSWAPPNQSGTGHVNPRPLSYVIKRISDYGFKIHEPKTQFIRAQSSFYYFKTNLCFFERNLG